MAVGVLSFHVVHAELGSTQLGHQELSSIPSVGHVGEVSRGDGQRAITDHIANSTVDLGLVLGEIGNLAVLLRVVVCPNKTTPLILFLTSLGSLEIESSMTAVPRLFEMYRSVQFIDELFPETRRTCIYPQQSWYRGTCKRPA